jgi:L-2-hydroxyglutarate oxidase LhgO
MPPEVNVAIIGAGVVGLAISAELAATESDVFVVERNHSFGLEISSRNSEVIHAGIYYPEGSLKRKFCVDGNRLLYDLCREYGVEHRRLGKIIVAVDDGELGRLEELHSQGLRNGAADLTLISRSEVKQLEPNVQAAAGILSPSTGILDAHGLMRCFHGLARERGASFVFETEVTGIEPNGAGYEVRIRDREGESAFTTRVLINAAGLASERIAGLAGIDTAAAGYSLRLCKGEYFSVNSTRGAPVGRLVYPLPEHAGQGIHVSLSLDGLVRLGPNARYVDDVDYAVDEGQRETFCDSVRRFLPGLRPEELEPDFAGMRPKLQGPDDGFRDFVVADEAPRGLPGLVNLVGIESPGLTGSPAIARHVAGMVREMLH